MSGNEWCQEVEGGGNVFSYCECECEYQRVCEPEPERLERKVGEGTAKFSAAGSAKPMSFFRLVMLFGGLSLPRLLDAQAQLRQGSNPGIANASAKS